MRRAAVSIFVQISTARGIRISPRDVSTSSSGVPEISSPGNCTSRTVPRGDGASASDHGGEENDRNEGRILEHGTADEVRHEILSRGQRHTLFERKQHLEPTVFFRFRDGIDAFKMKNRLPAMILAQPAGFQQEAVRLILAIGMSCKNFPQSCQAFRKIG